MSKNRDNSTPPISAPSSAASFDAEKIFDRVASISGAKNDAQIAHALGVSRQSMSKWRQSAHVPFADIAQFALKHDASLDYLLLGRGAERGYGGLIDLTLISEIGEAIGEEAKGRGPSGVGRHSWAALRPDLAYACALVYNRVVRLARPSEERASLIPEEVGYLFDVLSKQGLADVGVRLHPEEADHAQKLGVPLSENVMADRPIGARAPRPRKRGRKVG